MFATATAPGAVVVDRLQTVCTFRNTDGIAFHHASLIAIIGRSTDGGALCAVVRGDVGCIVFAAQTHAELILDMEAAESLAVFIGFTGNLHFFRKGIY